MCAQIMSFEDLECWKAGRDLRLYVSRKLLPLLPPDEKYRLGDQVTRAARSVPANIAEGYGRNHYLDNAKFCRNAMGSCCEVLDHAICAHDEGWISDEMLRVIRSKVDGTGKLLNGYIAYLKRAAATAAE
jgi:four helix bundle protein